MKSTFLEESGEVYFQNMTPEHLISDGTDIQLSHDLSGARPAWVVFIRRLQAHTV